MKLLIRNILVTGKNSPHNGKKKDILIDRGIITRVDDQCNEAADEVVEANGLHISAGWVDMCANVCDPGEEHKETLETAAAAALAGGFTTIVAMPGTKPPVSGKSQVEYIMSKSTPLPVTILPCGSLSAQMDGENISEMYDMKLAGAVAFCDYKNYVKAGLMSRAMLYAKNFGGRIMSFPNEISISKGGMMHEGIQSTLLGLKGIPELAEEIQVIRDIYLAEYNQTGIHFVAVSSAKSVDLIKAAKSKGWNVSCQVAAHQLYFTDADLEEFNTSLKVIPPLRTASINRALEEGLKNGTIDCICSDHCPQDPESKNVEFDHAEYGIIGLETAFGAANAVLSKHMKTDEIVEKMTTNPRKLLGLERIEVEVGSKAELTIFDPEKEWTFTEKDIRSKSKNTPFIGKKLKGKAIAIFNKGRLVKI
ncbi:MAG: dihydroorotase [Bacteroidota bacterium]